MNDVYLKSKELSKLKRIGQGTEGTVFLYQNNLVIKIYHKNKQFRSNSFDNVKIYQMGNFSSNDFYEEFKYYTYAEEEQERIRLVPKDALSMAIERGKDIKYTFLPIGRVYLDGFFAGSVLKRIKGIQVHKLSGFPLKIKKKIFLNILREEKELLEKHIYHIDLHNSPFNKTNFLGNNSNIYYGHSHVLVQPFSWITNFIDLDGKSTIYTEKGDSQNKYLKQYSLDNLAILALEFLFKIDYSLHEQNLDELYTELEHFEIPWLFKQKLVENQMKEVDDFKELIKVLK